MHSKSEIWSLKLIDGEGIHTISLKTLNRSPSIESDHVTFNGKDQCLIADYDPIMNLAENKEITLSAWVKLDPDSKGMGGIFEKSVAYYFIVEDRSPSFYWYQKGTQPTEGSNPSIIGVNKYIRSESELGDGWNHVAVALKDDLIKIFINGKKQKLALEEKLLNTDEYRIKLLPNDSERWMTVGCADIQNHYRYFSGSISDIKIFDAGFTEEQISELFESGRNS